MDNISAGIVSKNKEKSDDSVITYNETPYMSHLKQNCLPLYEIVKAKRKLQEIKLERKIKEAETAQYLSKHSFIY